MRLAVIGSLIAGVLGLFNWGTGNTYINPLGYCQLTASSAAALVSTCTGGIPATSQWATICVETANIRWRDDGTAPTTSVGMPVSSGQCFYYNSKFSALSVIAQSGSPVLDISFYDGPGWQ